MSHTPSPSSAFASDPTPDSALEITPLGPVDTASDAWNLLQTQRLAGWVTFPDAVVILDPRAPGPSSGFAPGSSGPTPRPFLAAELSHGPESVHVRFDGTRWHGWRYVRRPGSTHLTEEVRWLAVEGASVAPPGTHLAYERFWALTPDPVQPELQVWTPVAARFCGFRTEEAT
jgi:hypothetical protein